MEAVKPNAWQRKKMRRCLRLVNKFIATAEDDELAADERARKYNSFCDDLVHALRSLGKESLAILVDAFYWSVGEALEEQNSSPSSETETDESDDTADDDGEEDDRQGDGDAVAKQDASIVGIDDFRQNDGYDTTDDSMESSEEHEDFDEENESDDQSESDASDDDTEEERDDDRFGKFQRLVASYLDEYADELNQKIH